MTRSTLPSTIRAAIVRLAMSATVVGVAVYSYPPPITALQGQAGGLPPDGTVADDGGPSLEGIIGADDRVRVEATTAFPWRAVADLDVYFPYATTSCTGFFVGPHTVVTAGHCIYSPNDGGTATSIKIMPGRNSGDLPYPSETVPTASLHVPSQWEDAQDPEYDYGAIILSNDDLGNEVGWFKVGVLTDDELRGQLVNVAGYPAVDEREPSTIRFFDLACTIYGCQLWLDADPVADVTSRLVSYAADTSGGQSGAPVWRFNGSWQAVAIHTHGYKDQICAAGANCGTRITSEVIHHLKEWGGDSPSPPPPPSPPAPPCVPRADFQHVESFPDGTVVQPGQSMDKWWRVKNSGTCEWSGYQLMFESGEQMGGPSSVAIPSTPAGATVDIHVSMVAPTSAGRHTGYWRVVSPSGAWVDGGRLWVTVDVKGSTTGGHITVFDVTPASPSEATHVHLVGRIKSFSDFRSMRFVAGTQPYEMENPVWIGDEYQISADWETATLPRGDYTIVFEVARIGDSNWANPERWVRTYTLIGTPAPSGHAPDRPVLQSPYNWYFRDNAGSPAAVELCVYPVGSDSGPVSYQFDVNSGAVNSGWVSANCWNHTYNPATYAWKVKAKNDAEESDWSSETWHFTVASGGVSIGDIQFFNTQTNDTHICVPISYGGIQGPEVKAFMNQATDGSANGPWRQLDGYGPNAPPDCTTPNVWGFWIRSPSYASGNHLIRVDAYKPDSGATATRSANYTINYIKPPDPEPLAPSTHSNNGTWWNTPTIVFRWEPALRAESYGLRVATVPYPWDAPALLLDQTLPAGTTVYTHTFTQDYPALYWTARAINSQGYGSSGEDVWFGIDRVLPSCQVQALPATTYESVFQVNWSGADNAAGVRSYDIQYRDSGRGAWIDWLLAVPAAKTYELFTGQPGHTYAFRCRATDNAGNTGNYPGTGDTSTKVDPAARPPTPWWNTSYGTKRSIVVLNNMGGLALPAGYPALLHFDGTTTPTAAEIYDASQSTPKCRDLRVVYNDATELDRVVQTCTSSTIDIWFRTQVGIAPGSSNSTAHQLYYSYAGAGIPPGSLGSVFYPAVDSHTRAALYVQEGSGLTAYDSSGWANNGSIGGDAYWTDGKWGKAIAFPSTDGQCINLGAPASLNLGPVTVEGWYRHDEPTWWARLAGQLGGGGQNTGQNKWLFEYRQTRLHVHIWPSYPGAIETSDFLPGGAQGWHHYAFTFDGVNTVKIYFDGQLKATGNPGGSYPSGNTTVEFGCSEHANRVKGRMQNMAISNIVRTDFSYGAFAAITSEPTAAAGAAQAPPTGGSPDLVLQALDAHPAGSGLEGGVIVQAVLTNEGDRATENGFFTDLYSDHLPTGPGDYSSSLGFWVDNPIEAGSTVTLTTLLTGTQTGLAATMLEASITESSTTLYGQTDSTGSVTEPDDQNNISQGAEVCVASDDLFEPDNSPAQAQPILGLQTHNINTLTDEDWVSFSAEAGQTYALATSGLGLGADTYLYLYDTDGATLLAANDDFGGTLASRIVWDCPATGIYYAAVKHWNPKVSGCGTTYDLSFGEQHAVFLPLALKVSGLGSASVATVQPVARTATPTPVEVATPTPSLTPTATETPTLCPEPAITATVPVTDTATPTSTPSPTEEQEPEPEPTSTSTPTPAQAAVPTPMEVPTPTTAQEEEPPA